MIRLLCVTSHSLKKIKLGWASNSVVKHLLNLYKALDWNTAHTEKKRRDGQIHTENDCPKHCISTEDWRRKRRVGLCLQGTHSWVRKTRFNAKCYAVMQRRPKRSTSEVTSCRGTKDSRTGEGQLCRRFSLDRTRKPDSAVDQDSSFHLLARGCSQRISKKWGWRGRQEIQEGPYPAKD